ncbi:MAG: hypothetical protein K6D37_05790, partial [Prevotella sp.]|nr:hypothetical protein [Prevotella sp.]
SQNSAYSAPLYCILLYHSKKAGVHFAQNPAPKSSLPKSSSRFICPVISPMNTAAVWKNTAAVWKNTAAV